MDRRPPRRPFSNKSYLHQSYLATDSSSSSSSSRSSSGSEKSGLGLAGAGFRSRWDRIMRSRRSDDNNSGAGTSKGIVKPDTVYDAMGCMISQAADDGEEGDSKLKNNYDNYGN